MTYHYDLISEPWVPCVTDDGRMEELGLRDALVQAHRFRELGGESPLVSAALYRLLLAVVHRVFGPEGRDAWAELWARKCWDAAALDAYFARWRHRFDLFDEDRPFFQGKHPSIGFSQASDLAHEYCRADTFFDHRIGSGELVFAPGEAARHLLTAQAFGRWMTKGPYGQLPFGTCARGIVFLVKGDNLFESLILNMIRYPTRDDVLAHEERDAPCWEMDDPFEPERAQPFGLLDHLTWLSRRIWLQPELVDGRMVVRTATIAPGLRMQDDVFNPMLEYKNIKKKGGNGAIAFSEERMLWRDSEALFRLPGRDGKDTDTRPPASLDWLAALIEDGTPGLDQTQTRTLMALGMAGDTNQYRVHFYRREELPLPLALLQNQKLVEHLEAALSEGEAVRSNLWGALATLACWILFHNDGKNLSRPARDTRDNLIKFWGVERNYWAALEPSFFTLLADLPGDPQNARRAWAETLRRAAWDALEQAIANLSVDPTNLKAAVMARAHLGAGLSKTLDLWFGHAEPTTEEDIHA